MKANLNLSIPNPCSANWDEMTAVEQGKFCGLCSHTVVDFTNMSDVQIKEYFTCHYGQKTCGRFKTSQLMQKDASKNFWKSRIEKAELHAHQSLFKTILFFGLTFITLLLGCRRTSTTNSPQPHLMGDIETMGEPKFEQVDTTSKVPVPSIEEPVKMGKIRTVK